MKLRSRFLAVLALALLTGCPKKDQGEGESQSTEGSSAVAKGLRAPGNDAAIVELATRAATCTWDDIPTRCAEYNAWRKASSGFADPGADATLVNLLEDPDEKVRLLAAEKLGIYGKSYRTDTTLATRVVAALENEKSTRFVITLGEKVAMIDVEKTGLFDRVKALILTHPGVWVRSRILVDLLRNNKDSARVYDFTVSMLESPDKDLRNAALGGLAGAGGGVERQAEVCNLFSKSQDDVNDSVAEKATVQVLGWRKGACRGLFDIAIDHVDKAIESARLLRRDGYYMNGLGDMCASRTATPAQTKKAAELTRRVAGMMTSKFVIRIAALTASKKCDPAGAEAFLAKFADDQDEVVRRHVKDMLQP